METQEYQKGKGKITKETEKDRIEEGNKQHVRRAVGRTTKRSRYDYKIDPKRTNKVTQVEPHKVDPRRTPKVTQQVPQRRPERNHN